MKTSPAGIALIGRFEGLRIKAYRDGNGKWTIGYGHLERDGADAAVAPPVQYETQAQAKADLCADVAEAEAAVMRLVSVPLTQGQFDALVSFTYNEGPGRLRGSTLLNLLNTGDYAGAAKSFSAWEIIAGKHSDGLETRRNAEAALFLGVKA